MFAGKLAAVPAARAWAMGLRFAAFSEFCVQLVTLAWSID
jgi:hypothetical protein